MGIFSCPALENNCVYRMLEHLVVVVGVGAVAVKLVKQIESQPEF